MKKLLVVTLLLFVVFKIYANPNFTVGSNYYYTIFAYPHDILKWPKKGFFVYTCPKTLPWQGDITDISNMPDETYQSNYTDFAFPVPNGYTGDPKNIYSYMKVSSYAYDTRYSAGGIWDFGEDLGKIYFELGTNRIDMELEAEGIVRNNESLELVPVTAGTEAERRNYDVQLIYANYLFDNPFGLKIQYQSKDSKAPNSFIKFTQNGREISSNRITWGWTTSPCNHIFGMEHQNFDAWYLPDYTLYKGGQLDVQLSYEHGDGKYKTGIRYRKIDEQGKEFFWQSGAPGDRYENFIGQYITDSRYENEIDIDLIRAYSKIRFWKFGDLDMGLLFFGQYASHNENRVSTNKELESDPLRTDAQNEYTIEINPWLNYKFDKNNFDLGVLFEASYTTMKNVSPRWNSSLGANQQDVIRNSSPSDDGFSPSWETFSQGNYFFLATGFEAYSSINIYGRLNLLTTLTLLRKYSFITKEYGQSVIPAGGSSYEFQRSHKRDDYKNETWMTGSIGFAYGWGPIQTIASMQLPLAYLLEKSTELTNNSITLVDRNQRNVWAVQEPVTFRLLFIFGLER
ncbi:MAG: hypothetical protein GXX85_10620 [Ignavibacteria bacterium]|nr:hypothetical protein [Ignavibacteria bacterium]